MAFSQKSVFAGILLSGAVILAIDLLLPLGVAGGVPYVAVVLMTVWIRGGRSTYLTAGITTALVAVGFALSPAGPEQWMALVNRLLAVFGIWIAAVVTDRFKSNQEALRRANSTVEAILDAAPDGIVTFDEDGRIRRFSTTAESMFGYEESETIGAPIQDLFDRETGEQVDEAFWEPLADPTDERRTRTLELIGRARGGRTFPVRMGVSYVSREHGPLYVAILRDVSHRREVERELAGLTEPERQRIGHELNESLGQMLSGMGLITEDVVRKLEEEGVETVSEVARISRLLKEADEQVRTVTNRLVPVNLEANEFGSALEELALKTEREHGVDCQVTVRGDGGRLADNTVATHLYRIAEEAITNAIEHGRAEHVRIRLHLGDQKVRMRIEDDGTGFDETVENVRRMGMRTMEYRARLVGATLSVRSGKKEGTCVTCTLPLTVGHLAQ